MSSRKLRVIGYDKPHVDCDDDADFTRLLCFVEEKYLHKKNEDWMVSLLDEKDKDKWNMELDKYLLSCGLRCTHETSRRTVYDQLLNSAIDVLYYNQGGVHDLAASRFVSLKEAKIKNSQNSQNPLNNLDYSSAVVQGHIKELCKTIGIIDHPSPEIQLQAACIFIRDNLSSKHIQDRNDEEKNGKNIKTFDLKSFPLGMAKQNDEALNRAVRCLRLLGVDALRETQTKVNETLVAIQGLTKQTPRIVL